MRAILTLIIFGRLLTISLAQNPSQSTLKINKILDCNLFLSSDNDTLKLIGVHCPNPFSDSLAWGTFKTEMMNYLQQRLTNPSLKIKAIDTTRSGRILILAWQEFPEGKKIINIEFLEKGYGKFDPHPAIQDSSLYLKAQSLARAKLKGLWRYQKIRIKPLKPYRYLRMCGGVMIFPPRFFNEKKVRFFPSVSIGYHIGDFLKYDFSSQNKLTLAGQVYTLFGFLLPIFQIGPEFYSSSQRIGIYYGVLYPILLNKIGTDDLKGAKMLAFELGKRKFYSDGHWLEMLLTVYWFYKRDAERFLFKIEMNLPHF